MKRLASQYGSNLSFTKFLFVVPRRDDDAVGTTVRAAGALIARGFFNDFDAAGHRDAQARESIQFLVADRDRHADCGIAAARYVVQVSGKYRPRLQEVEAELRRRVGDAGEVLALDGAERPMRYSSPELYDYAIRPGCPRKSG